MQFGDLDMLLMCIFPCDFGVVSDDIWHCSGLFGCCLCIKTIENLAILPYKRFVLYGFYMVSIRLLTGEMGLYVECVT